MVCRAFLMQSRNYVTVIVTSANCNEDMRRLLSRWIYQTIKFCKRSSGLATVPRLSLTLIFGVLVGLVGLVPQFHHFWPCTSPQRLNTNSRSRISSCSSRTPQNQSSPKQHFSSASQQGDSISAQQATTDTAQGRQLHPSRTQAAS